MSQAWSHQKKRRGQSSCSWTSDRFPTDGTLGRSGIVKHEIRTGDAPPRFMQPTRVDHSMRGKLDEMVDDMLRREVIRPSVSPYAARVVTVQKKMAQFDYVSTIADSMRTPRGMPFPSPGSMTVLTLY